MPEDRTDWALAEEVETGTDAAFDVLMERYKRPIISFAYRMIGDAHEAEDLAQDVFVRAYRNLSAGKVRRTAGRFSTWLFQVAHNAALDRLRKRKRWPTESLAVVEALNGSVPGTGRTPADEVVARETGEQIATAIQLLPEDQRTALVLAEYEGLSSSAIADIMRCSGKSVEARLYRARRFLRRRLAHLLT